MSLASLTETSTTIAIQHGSKQFLLDTTTLESHACPKGEPLAAGVIGREVTVTLNGREFVAPEVHQPDCSKDLAILKGGILLEDFLAQEMADPAVSAASQRVRKELGRRKQRSGLAKLRLESGLSQADVARRLNTQQSAVARLEHNPTSLNYSTICNLAVALNCTPHAVFDAIYQHSKQQTSVDESRYEAT